MRSSISLQGSLFIPVERLRKIFFKAMYALGIAIAKQKLSIGISIFCFGLKNIDCLSACKGRKRHCLTGEYAAQRNKKRSKPFFHTASKDFKIIFYAAYHRPHTFIDGA